MNIPADLVEIRINRTLVGMHACDVCSEPCTWEVHTTYAFGRFQTYLCDAHLTAFLQGVTEAVAE